MVVSMIPANPEAEAGEWGEREAELAVSRSPLYCTPAWATESETPSQKKKKKKKKKLTKLVH
jgi:hypothetical protein